MQKLNKSNKSIVYVDTSGKVPPQAIDIEEAVIGTIINDFHLIGKFPYLKPEVFYKDVHQIIYRNLLEMYDKGLNPDQMTLISYMQSNNTFEECGGIVYITKISGYFLAYIDTHVKILMDKYFYREIIRISTLNTYNAFDSQIDPVEIIDNFQSQILDLLDFDIESQDNFSNSLERTIDDIKLSAKGDNTTVIKTGHKHLDKRFTFRTRFVCIVAGPEASGKTKYVTNLIRGMLDNESDLAVLWFSFEDDRKTIIRAFLSMDLRITGKEIQSINYKMTDDDIKNVELFSKKYSKYKIDFIDHITSIQNIVSRSKRFSDKYKDKKKVIIIDNLGLIDCDKSGIERDDYIAAKIKAIADMTNASIILVHHFTKEIARKQNLEDGYRPRKEYLKGSTRILDYVQQALFVNLIRKYPDLLADEKQQSLEFIGLHDVPFNKINYDKYLWSLNSKPDKESKSIIDLYSTTYATLATLIMSKTKLPNGNIITFSDVVQKYTEYSNHIDIKNKGREAKYMEPKMSIHSFIVKKEFNSSYVIASKSKRSSYLYGNNENIKHHIDDLFIVESVKNRDDDNLSENAIFRYIADLGYNIFTELDNDNNIHHID